MNHFSLLFTAFLWITGTASAQMISVEDFTTRNQFVERSVTGINWMNDGKYYTALVDNRILQYDVTTGEPVRTIVDGSALRTSIVIEDYSFSRDEKKILLQSRRQDIYRRSFTAEYFVYHIESQQLLPLSSGGRQSYATFSPDGTRVAFVRANDLFYVELDDMREHRATEDGKFNHIINGTTDWVYEEEFGFVVGFAWSPDGDKLAYYRFDESHVKEYNLQLWGNLLYPADYRYKYPKAGEENARVEVWVYDLKTAQRSRMDTGSEADMYIPRMQWTADSNVLSIRTLNRLQNNLALLHANASTGETRRVLEERSDTYIDIEVLDDLTYLSGGKQFIASSERDGFKHLYLYNIDGQLVRPLTSGDFEVTAFLGMDAKTGLVYYTSTEASPLERHFYSVALSGRRKERLSTSGGTHTINMSPDFQFYIDHHSSADHPNVVTLYQTKKNRPFKVLERNEQLISAVRSKGVVPKQFFSFENNAGVGINGFMLKPPGFDSTRIYPLMLYQYSGPGSQEVLDKWGADHYYFHQMLAQSGYIVAFIDSRGTGGRGEQFKKATYKDLGKLELEDILSAANYFSTLRYIDGGRMGIWGWSYGGYMSSLALTKGAGTFKMGVAVSPVTNWRFYDTIYTERYLQTPQLNPEGYDRNSPLSYAGKLEGSFLLIHGTGDDNVHVQNSIVFQDALIDEGKAFESFFYPDKDHSIPGAATKHHLYSMLLRFVKKNL